MPNLYYDNQDPPIPLSRTRAGNEDSDRERIEQAFDKLPTEDELKSGAVNYTVDTGVADMYVVTIPYATAYFEGLNILFKILNANTGASTIDVNGLGPKSMVSPDGTALQVGDLVAGGATSIVYDGAVFRLVIAASANARSAADDAAASAAAALVSEQAAAASEVAAGLSETAAGVSESNSAASAAAALVSENAALVSEGNASTSETNSAASAAAALVSENAASVSEGNASTSEINSAASEAAALISQDAAEDWAIQPEDVPVPIVSGGDGSTTFSSLHWAAKAAAFALAIDLSSPAPIGDVAPNTGDFTNMTLTLDLLQAAGRYHNWGAVVGDSGYGVRDLAGVMQFKDSGGAWAAFGSGAGIGEAPIDGTPYVRQDAGWVSESAPFDPASPGPIGGTTPSTGDFTTGDFTRLTVDASGNVVALDIDHLAGGGAATVSISRSAAGGRMVDIIMGVGNSEGVVITANLLTSQALFKGLTNSASFSGSMFFSDISNTLSTGNAFFAKHEGTGTGGFGFVADMHGGTIFEGRLAGVSKFRVNTDGGITQAPSLYHNFSLTAGDSGYGFRDLAGVMQVKDSGGAWAAFGGGGGIPDAPVDGVAYVRKDAGWLSETSQLASPPNIGITAPNQIFSDDLRVIRTSADATSPLRVQHTALAALASVRIERSGTAGVGLQIDHSASASEGMRVTLTSMAAPSAILVQATNSGASGHLVFAQFTHAGATGTGFRISHSGITSGICFLASAGGGGANLFEGRIGGGGTTVFHVTKLGNILTGAGLYHNWSLTEGSAGYGVRDLAGVMQSKNSGGAWAALVAGAGTVLDNSLVRQDGTSGASLQPSTILIDDVDNVTHSAGQSRHKQNAFTTAIDCDLGHVFTQTLTVARIFSFSNEPASGTDTFVTLILTDAGDFAITWPASVEWPGGSPPTFTSGGTDIVTLVQYDAGTTWRASAILDIS